MIRALREWDLWGPLVYTLLLSVALSLGSSSAQSMFALVFAIVGFGSCILTLNCALLGGKIIFFQSLSLLGYCLSPLVLAVFLAAAWPNAIYRSVCVTLGIVWAAVSSVPFVTSAVSPSRRFLAIYPLILLYVCVGWLSITN